MSKLQNKICLNQTLNLPKQYYEKRFSERFLHKNKKIDIDLKVYQRCKKDFLDIQSVRATCLIFLIVFLFLLNQHHLKISFLSVKTGCLK